MINATEFLFVVERKYLEPATKTGPSPNEVMPPVVLVFDRMESDAVPAPDASDAADAAGEAASPVFGEQEEEAAQEHARPALRRARA